MNRLKSLIPFRFLPIVVAASIGSLMLCSGVFAASPRDDEPQSLFDAMKAKEADVRLIPDSAAGGRLLVKNLTKQPLVLEVPDVFAALPEHHPVLAQFADLGMGNVFPGQGQGFPGQGQGFNVGLGNGQQFGGTQALGGGNPMGPQNGGQQFGNPLFRIPPGGMEKVAVTTVCLEYGKPQPNRRIVYRLIPMDQLTQNDRVASVCRLVGSRQIDQKVGQAMAWHFINELSWDDLRRVNARVSRYTGSTRMFRDSEIEEAKALAHRMEQSQSEGDESARLESTLTGTAP